MNRLTKADERVTGADAVIASAKIISDRYCRPFEPLQMGSVSFLTLELAWFIKYVRSHMKSLDRFRPGNEGSLD